MIQGLHHVQIAMPKGGESLARAFYGHILGLREIEKPEALRSRGGLWFVMAELEVHLGVEEPFAPAKKAHPAFQVMSLKDAIGRFSDHHIAVRTDIDLPTIRRVYVNDPFGNRIEILEVI